LDGGGGGGGGGGDGGGSSSGSSTFKANDAISRSEIGPVHRANMTRRGNNPQRFLETSLKQKCVFCLRRKVFEAYDKSRYDLL
jgi:hypothetical protein